jgi:hypothetical protein
MNVSELIGALLDYWVARAEGATPRLGLDTDGYGLPVCATLRTPSNDDAEPWWGIYRPRDCWAQGGPIIERERIELLHFGSKGLVGAPWEAQLQGDTHYIDQYPGDAMGGPTPLIAAMRAFVESKFGDTVPDDPT